MQPVWFLVVDEGHVRLMTMSHTKQGSPHVEEHASHELQVDEKEHGRNPMRQSPQGHSQAYAPENHETDENLRRRAHEISDWIDREVHTRKLERVTLFAPDRMLGQLRKQFPKRLAPRLDERHGNYAHLTTGQLAEIGKVQELVEN